MPSWERQMSTRLIRRDWSGITIHDGCQMDTKWKYFALSGLHLSSLFIHQLFEAPTPYSSTRLDWLTQHGLKPPKHRKTGRHLSHSTTTRSCSTNLWNFHITEQWRLCHRHRWSHHACTLTFILCVEMCLWCARQLPPICECHNL
jgi:hypothetical protein